MRHGREKRQLQITSQQADSLVDELSDALDADAIEEGRLEALKGQLEEAREDEITQKNQYGDYVEAKDKNNESVRATRNEMAVIDIQIADAEETVKKAESKATKSANQRLAALRDKNAAFDAVEKEKKNKGLHEKEHDEQVALVENFTEQANAFCERVPVDKGETSDSIERKWAKLEKDLAAAEKRCDQSSHINARSSDRTVVLAEAEAILLQQQPEPSKPTSRQETK